MQLVVGGNMRVGGIFSFVTGLLLLFSSPVSSETLFLIDTSVEMRKACESPTSGSPLKQANSLIKSAVSAVEQANIPLVLNFSGGKVNIGEAELASSVANPRHSISLSEMLANEIDHDTTAIDRVVIVGHSQAHQDEILDITARYSGLIPRFEVYLFSADAKVSLKYAVEKSVDGLTLSQYGCSTTDGWQLYVERVSRTVKQQIAEHFGLDAHSVSLTMGIYEDLGADSQKAFEVVASICGSFNVSLPESGLVKVNDITEYIIEAQLDAGLVNEFGDEVSFRDVPKSEEVYIQKVFYATNRQGDNEDRLTYGGFRASAENPVTYGTVDVAVPKSHKRGQLESPFLGIELFSDAKEYFQIARINTLEKAVFFSEVNAGLGKDSSNNDWRNDLVIFVHGFNVGFDEAAKRTAQIAYDFGFTGVPLMFSWPSDAQLLGYMSDREDVHWSIAHIEQFLEDVVDKVHAKRIHLIAHSMGNQGLIGALHRISMKRQSGVEQLFENIILAAPDFDAQLFSQQIAQEVIPLSDNWTIYTSDNDAALKISSKVNNAHRLGLPVTPVAGVSVIDATGIEVTPWSVTEFHSYYATKQQVIDDMVKVINGEQPETRSLIQLQKNGIPYWRFNISG